MKNTMLNFYVNNKVTTEHINIDEYDEYIQKRKNLYRQLGIPILAIKDADILEVGSGVGHNTIPLITKWGAKHIDMLEPNPVAAEELKSNFEARAIGKETYTIFPVILEEFKGEKKYDLVIAEGYVQFAHNWKAFLNEVKKYTHENSIVIVTCADEIGLYVERMKRVAGQYAVRDIERLEDKVEHLDKLWNGQKYGENLKGMTRSSKEWILDMIFNESSIFEHAMTMKETMDEMGDTFDILGASQNIFTDYSWYKDLSYDYKEAYKNQYDTKKHMLLIAGEYDETIRTVAENQKLEHTIKNVMEYVKGIEREEKICIKDFLMEIDKVSEAADNKKIRQYNEELKEILQLCAEKKEVEWEKYKMWKYTFGKSMQYISFERK